MKACFQIAECSFSYAKIMQTERRTTSLLDCYAEVQLIFCKGNTILLVFTIFANIFRDFYLIFEVMSYLINELFYFVDLYGLVLFNNSYYFCPEIYCFMN